ncbi:MAG: oxidoreductase [Chloroflexi bacterium]|nr:oxidoreductase [Chloroflexota bacterium]
MPCVMEEMFVDVGIGVVGCGYWGPNLVRNLAQTRGAKLLACCDLETSRLDWVRQGYPAVKVTADFQELLDDKQIDAIAIATPISTHYALVKQALKAGKHVLVAKPLAQSVAECQELQALAVRNNCVLLVDHTFLYTGAVRKIKELMDAGDLGDIYYYDSVRINLGLFQHDTNVIWDLAPHDIAIMIHLLGMVPERVLAVGASHVNEQVENIAYVTMMFRERLLAHLHVNWLAPAKVRRTIIGGSKRMVVYDDMDMSEKVKIYDSGAKLSNDPAHIYRTMVEYRTGDMYAPKIDKTEALAEECRHFVACIRDGADPISGAVLATQVVGIIEAADRSLKMGGSMEHLHRPFVPEIAAAAAS